ncbi:hypothetical protein PPE03_32220 [Pseudoalteromonas peptidolytica]|nr:hypothetical protein PPE03_32220 [Pseudoalteromonas peptidolytica]
MSLIRQSVLLCVLPLAGWSLNLGSRQYSNIARNYVCQSDYFEPKFEEGHQISIEFSKADSAQTVYERASVIKSDCSVSRS